jgi:hypothetical protein
MVRGHDWVGDIGTGLITVTVKVRNPEITHIVKVQDFERGGFPLILSVPAPARDGISSSQSLRNTLRGQVNSAHGEAGRDKTQRRVI